VYPEIYCGSIYRTINQIARSERPKGRLTWLDSQIRLFTQLRNVESHPCVNVLLHKLSEVGALLLNSNSSNIYSVLTSDNIEIFLSKMYFNDYDRLAIAGKLSRVSETILFKLITKM
jgi:hypothetical protein|tara:strand:- start:54 stop:404 length:351 start_codon:yes stop_codon:yes gene_type:complete